MIGKEYCACLYLMYRSLLDERNIFRKGIVTKIADINFPRVDIHNSLELFEHLYNEMKIATAEGDAALMLSSGIDSAILAGMFGGGQTYTLRCVVPGKEVIDETFGAKKFAKRNGLKNDVVEVYWEDFEKYSSILMRHKGAPIHSIEVQIYKAAIEAKRNGFKKLIFGENADIIYGGMDGLLAKDWTFDEFVQRYSYVNPDDVLRNSQKDLTPFENFTKNNMVDAYAFINEYFRKEALGSYINACEVAGVEFVGPFSTSRMAVPMDYKRVRSGDSKYLVREVFKRLYPNETMGKKTPMPRPMNEWMADWKGPVRDEFIPHCTDNMTGDQKWMVWCLERYLNLMEV